MHDHMKTITLSDEAYGRLKAWKDSTHDSFSKVVLAKVPKRGTLADLASQIDRLPRLSRKGASIIEKVAAWGNDWKS